VVDFLRLGGVVMASVSFTSRDHEQPGWWARLRTRLAAWRLGWKRRREERWRLEALAGLGQRMLRDIGVSGDLASLARTYSESQSERHLRTISEIVATLRSGQR